MLVCLCLPLIAACSHSKNGTDCFRQEDCPVGICRLGTCVEETRESPTTDTASGGEDSPEPFGDTDEEDTSTNNADIDKETTVDTGAETDSDETDTVPAGSTDTPTDQGTDTVSEAGTGISADFETDKAAESPTDRPTESGNDTVTESGNDTVTESGRDTMADTESSIEGDSGTVVTRDTETGSAAGESDTIPQNAVFVSIDGSDSDGDGTASNPYRTVTKGLSVTEAGDTVWVKTGDFQEGEEFPLDLSPGVTLQGEDGASITSSIMNRDIIQKSTGGPAGSPTRMINLSLTGEQDGWHIDGGYVEIQDVHLSGGGNFGLSASINAHVSLENVEFHGFGEPTDWGPGAAIWATNSAWVTGTAVTIADPPALGAGILAQENAHLEFDDTTIANRNAEMTGRSDGPCFGPCGENGYLVYKNLTVGIFMVLKSNVSLKNCEISNNGSGVLVFDESTLTFEGGSIANSLGIGLWGYNQRPELGMIDVKGVDVIHNGGVEGFGVEVLRKNFSIRESTISYNGFDGMVIGFPGDGAYTDPIFPTVATIFDTVIEGNNGQGLIVWDTLMPVALERVRFVDNLNRMLSDEEEENLAQLYFAPKFTGTVHAADVEFSFDEESGLFAPLPETVNGPASYRDETSGLLHYNIVADGGAIVFESSEPE